MRKIFIVGTGRSGTHMLRRALNLHADIFITQETHWWPLLFQEYGLTENSVERYFTIVEGCHYSTGYRMLQVLLRDTAMDMPQFFAAIQERLQGRWATVSQFGELLYETLAQANNATISGDKTPEYGAYMQTIKVLWPDAKFVHVVRDGRSVACSMARHHGFRLMAKYGIVNWPIVAFSGSRRYPLPWEHGRTWKRILGIPLERDYKFPDFMQLWGSGPGIRDEIDRVPSETSPSCATRTFSRMRSGHTPIADFGEFQRCERSRCGRAIIRRR
jgi:hypothetical protein